MVLRSAHTLLLPLAACVSVALFGSIPGDGVHPFAMAASLLPLQLAALFWSLSVLTKGAESQPEGSRPPANG